MVNVMLAEDHTIVRNGIKMLLEIDKDISVVAEATNGKEAVRMLQEGCKIDVILADINMPEMDGIAMISKVLEINPEVKVIILSMFDSEKYVAEAFAEGASCYLLKNISVGELIFSVKHVSLGGKYLCTELSNKLLDRLIQRSNAEYGGVDIRKNFSVREINVLKLIAEGFTNGEMAERLFISKRTIEGHRQTLIEKTGSRNTASLIKYAVLNGIVQ
ncbi:DNA-binding NarL/FixJ family response regulator [Pedobacter sp. CG_S7]|uniref:response regulator transcription factor n=1 Tax=Pedobacter sp. CG_S7 TaxID=3143930 RepID=UPI00339222D6